MTEKSYNGSRNKISKRMRPKQHAAIVLQVKTAHRIRTHHTSLVDRVLDLHRKAYYAKEIVQEENLQEHFELNEKNAIKVVHYIICGFHNEGKFNNLPKFDPLLDKSELEELAYTIHKRLGLDLKYANLGVFSLDKDKRSEIGRKSGKKAYELKLGVHGLTPEERKANHLSSMVARGYVPFKEQEGYRISEKEFIYRIASHEKFANYKGGTNISKVRDQVNLSYHKGREVRTYISIRNLLRRDRESRKLKPAA